MKRYGLSRACRYHLENRGLTSTVFEIQVVRLSKTVIRFDLANLHNSSSVKKDCFTVNIITMRLIDSPSVKVILSVQL